MPDQSYGVDYYSAYGVSLKRPVGTMKDGDSFQMKFDLDAGQITLDLKYYSPETVERVLKACGFEQVIILAMTIPDEALEAMPAGY